MVVNSNTIEAILTGATESSLHQHKNIKNDVLLRMRIHSMTFGSKEVADDDEEEINGHTSEIEVCLLCQLHE